jgi:hypothetical protein
MAFYTCKVSYDNGTSESGRAMVEKIEYLVEGLSTMEVETKMATFMKDAARDYEITGITKSRVAEVIN